MQKSNKSLRDLHGLLLSHTGEKYSKPPQSRATKQTALFGDPMPSSSRQPLQGHSFHIPLGETDASGCKGCLNDSQLPHRALRALLVVRLFRHTHCTERSQIRNLNTQIHPFESQSSRSKKGFQRPLLQRCGLQQMRN